MWPGTVPTACGGMQIDSGARAGAGQPGTFPSRIVASAELSRLPPETTAHTLASAYRPDSAAATDTAPAPSATTWLYSTMILIAAATSVSDTVMTSSIMDLASGHISGKTVPNPTPLTKPGACGFSAGAPAANAAWSGCALASSQAMIFTSGLSARTAQAMPQASPPPPNGIRIASISGDCCNISSPIVASPASEGGSRAASI